MKTRPWLPWLSAWLILNLIQSLFTELWHDEAHYWMFSQHLAWGYWDHPPMTPLLVKLGYALIPNELGVRLFIVLINTATIYFLYKIVSPANVKLFFMMVFGTAIVHVGWMAAPDLSLLFFTSTFLYIYQKYTERDTWQTAFLLGFIVACMAYSKYHGALVLFFALIGNWKLLKRPSFYVIPVVAAILFIPHLHWQYENGFPTFVYHLIDRNKDLYQWRFISDYVLGQVLIYGPFLSFVLFPYAWKYKTENDFEKSLKWILFGIIAFFFYQSFNQRTEANWTATAFLPLIYLAYKYIENQEDKHRLIYRLAIPTMVLIGICRVFLIWDFLPEGMNPRNEFHNWDKWAEDISEVAGEHPVVFYNGYKDASKYRFYAQKPAIGISVHHHVGTQYELMYEEAAKFQGDTVVSVSGYHQEHRFNPGGLKETGWKYKPNFRSYNSIKIELIGDCPEILPADTELTLPIRIVNKTPYDYNFNGNPEHPAQMQFHVYSYEDVILWGSARPDFPQQIIKGNEVIETTATMRTPKEPGEYRWRFDIDVKDYHNSRNMTYCDIVVE